MEKLLLVSTRAIDPTVNADGADAGDLEIALTFSLPAATTTIMPAALARSTALFSVELLDPPSDMLRMPFQ